jgi:peptidyl-prolyl cis-trans isomerase A (cyclophilin A)
MSGETASIKCGSSAGSFEMEMIRAWSPMGYDRAVELFEKGYYDQSHFFRVVPKFLVQFGISYTTDEELKRFARTTIPDDVQLDPPIPFVEGTISYAGSGDNSRSSQIFISYTDKNTMFGTNKWETPVGRIVEGMDHVRNFYSYGDMPPWGKGPVQGKIHSGRAYIEEGFPLTDKFLTCTVERRGNGEEDVEEDLVKEVEEQDAAAAAAAAEDEPEKDWSSKAVKMKMGDIVEDKPGLNQAFKQLRSKVQESDSTFDVLAMGGILFVILIAVFVKLTILKPKKGSKTS